MPLTDSPDAAPHRIPARIRHLGRQAYAPIYEQMRAFTTARDAATPDEIWVVEHDPVFTLGQAASTDHVLNPGDIPCVPTDRGGQVTYHGPGQVVVYPLLDLRRRGIGPRGLVRGIEQVLIDYLGSLDIRAERRAGAPGVFVGLRKIASIGLRIRKAGCYHGLALNLDMDLAPFTRINPCGYAGLEMTQVAHFQQPPDVRSAGDALACRLDTMLVAGTVAQLLADVAADPGGEGESPAAATVASAAS